MLGYFKNLLGKKKETPGSPEPAPVPEPLAPPPVAPLVAPADPPEAAAQLSHRRVQRMLLALKPITDSFPESLKGLIATPPAETAMAAVSLDLILEQSPTGRVEISIGELRKIAPANTFVADTGQDHLCVDLPFAEIDAKLNSPVWVERLKKLAAELEDSLNGETKKAEGEAAEEPKKADTEAEAPKEKDAEEELKKKTADGKPKKARPITDGTSSPEPKREPKSPEAKAAEAKASEAKAAAAKAEASAAEARAAAAKAEAKAAQIRAAEIKAAEEKAAAAKAAEAKAAAIAKSKQLEEEKKAVAALRLAEDATPLLTVEVKPQEKLPASGLALDHNPPKLPPAPEAAKREVAKPSGFKLAPHGQDGAPIPVAADTAQKVTLPPSGLRVKEHQTISSPAQKQEAKAAPLPPSGLRVLGEHQELKPAKASEPKAPPLNPSGMRLKDEAIHKPAPPVEAAAQKKAPPIVQLSPEAAAAARVARMARVAELAKARAEKAKAEEEQEALEAASSEQDDAASEGDEDAGDPSENDDTAQLEGEVSQRKFSLKRKPIGESSAQSAEQNAEGNADAQPDGAGTQRKFSLGRKPMRDQPATDSQRPPQRPGSGTPEGAQRPAGGNDVVFRQNKPMMDASLPKAQNSPFARTAPASSGDDKTKKKKPDQNVHLEAVRKACWVEGVAGAMALVNEYSVLAVEFPSELSVDSMLDVVPQLFPVLDETAAESQAGDPLPSVRFHLGGRPAQIWKAGLVFFVVIGEVDGALPSNKLALIAYELVHKAR